MTLGRALDYLLAKRTACEFADICTAIGTDQKIQRLLETQLQNSQLVERSLRGLYRHVWCTIIQQLAEDCRYIKVCLHDWISKHHASNNNRQLTAYIVQHREHYQLHTFRNDTYVRKQTAYNIYDKQSFLKTIATAGRLGLNAIKVYQEYPRAYTDVQELIKANTIYALHDQLWTSGVIHSLPQHLLGKSVFDVQRAHCEH